MEIKDKVVVISGGQSGLGNAVAQHLLNLGAKVMIFDLNVEDSLLDQRFGPSYYKAFQVDVSDSQSIKIAIDDIVSQYCFIHVCVNCAGIAPAKKIVDRQGQAQSILDFSHVININLIGTFNMCRLVAEKMQNNSEEGESKERGLIINTASIAAYEGQKGQCAYAASKGGIISMTLPMARDLGSLGIRVNAIAPGVMATPLMEAMPDAVKDQLSASIPFPKRMGNPLEFAYLVEHLIVNSYINAETIRLDGGMRMQ